MDYFNMSSSEREEFNSKHIWHPYTSMIDPLPCYHVKSAAGVYLELESGEKVIDGMSSWWCAIHGYNHKELNEAAYHQLSKMSHVMFGGITHDPAILLCKHLVDMTHEQLECVFLCDSGSVAVEVALKQAIQYWDAKEEPTRKKFLTITHGYHGDTFGAMSVCDPVNSMHTLYTGYVPANIFAKGPEINYGEQWNDADIEDFANNLQANKEAIAAVIVEPILQGAGGMKMYHPEYLKKVRQLTKQHNVLLILDEIATGFGRTGKLFAYEHANTVPDILCVGKAITGGYMTLAAVVSTRDVADTISKGRSGCFMHGPTFMANPLACAVASKNMEIIRTNKWRHQVSHIEEVLVKNLLPLKDQNYGHIRDVRVLGAIGVVELYENVDMAACQKKFIELQVWVRPFGRLVYIMPPYIVTDEELLRLIHAVITVAINCPRN